MSDKPTILFVHGAYHPPAVYSALTTALGNAGFDVLAPRLASLGSATHGVAVPDDDVAVLRAAVEPSFAEGKKVVVLAHSIGGFFSTAAIKGFTVAERQREGKAGGFAGVVYMNSTLPVSHEDTVMAVCDPASAVIFDVDVREDGKMVSFFKTDDASKDQALHFFYSCVPRELSEKVFSQLERFNTHAFLTPAATLASELEGIAKTYIVGEQDYVVPLAQQERIISSTPGMKEVRLAGCGHSPFLTHVDDVVKAVEGVAEEVA
ncbi:Alpha/beta hydrolase fold-1 [Microdochium trichocladiopsis]|uniref:Alpha/beta hydrolase fold-1 n=1 Tax=Microdochium trichocladiopsis TaxID=1682393 RepID=A0A9P8YJS2_9PEZI|nr:Alpha/beta hydrolase fold-1 [Microdochium trichocladiopsis]KAH7041570.1 Alpha/beta hydrolase fold-1 [Microdochium trichocladiopsis]